MWTFFKDIDKSLGLRNIILISRMKLIHLINKLFNIYITYYQINLKLKMIFTFKSAPAQNALWTELQIIKTFAEWSLLTASKLRCNPCNISLLIAFFAPGLSKLTSTTPVSKNMLLQYAQLVTELTGQVSFKTYFLVQKPQKNILVSNYITVNYNSPFLAEP